MHSAPSARYPVSRSRRAGLLLCAAWAMGAASVLGWIVSAPAPDGFHAGATALLAATASVLVRQWRSGPAGILAWDGQHWRWEPHADMAPPVLGIVGRALDLPSLMLLRFQPAQGQARWCWLDRASDPGAWHCMRCALAARQPAEASAGAEGGRP